MRNVVPDAGSVEIPYLGYEDKDALNRLTAYGRAELQDESRRCGCFRCGSTFLAGEIVDWMPEEDGEDTALCPYCGCDTVIYDTDRYPLSTALLAELYMDWFSSEFKERKKAATYAPSFSDYDDYLRRGIPFLMEHRATQEIVGEVDLFRIDEPGNATGFMHEDRDAWLAQELADGEPGGMADIVVHGSERAFVDGGEKIQVGSYFEFIDEHGRRLPYELWSPDQERRVCELSTRYGSQLKGLILSPSGRMMRLVVGSAPDRLSIQ